MGKDTGRTIGQVLRSLRGSRSLRDVEAGTKLSSGHLSLIENGKVKSPSPSVLQRLATFYGADPADLLVIAGYLQAGPRGRAGSLHGVALAQLHDLDEDDMKQVSDFVMFLRQRKKLEGHAE